MTLGDHLVQQLQRSLKTCCRERETCLASDSADAVHDLRVACRRVLETVRVFEQVLRPAPIGPVRESLRAWMRLSGAVRDLDIAIDLVRDTTVPGAGEMLSLLAARRERRALLARTQLFKPVPWPRKREVSAWLRKPKRGSHETLWDIDLSPQVNGALVLPLLLERYSLRGDPLLDPGISREEFHRFRLRTKRIRYATEWFVNLFPENGAAELLSTLKDFQQHLGLLQDCAATSNLLHRPSLRRSIGEEAGLSLAESVENKARSAQQHFVGAWTVFRRDSSFARWHSIFPLPAAKSDAPSRISRRRPRGA